MSMPDSVTTRETRFTSLSPTPMRGTIRNGVVFPGWASASEVTVDVAGHQADREAARPGPARA